MSHPSLSHHGSMNIDEDLHSRQLAVYGRHAMGKMSTTKVLVSGLDGLGAEIAKNVILAQVQAVTLHDVQKTTPADLGAQFYLQESDVGKNRATACSQRLQELNPTVNVHAVTTPLDAALVQAHDVVVLVGHPRAVAEQVSDWCRARASNDPNNPVAPARLTWCGVHGLFGFIFNDFGPAFVVNDTTGENPRTAIISNIVRGVETLVSCIDDERIDFEEGDIVQLHEVEGCDGIEKEEFKVSSVTKSSFKIGDTTKYKEYVKGGTVVQVKQPKTLTFAPVREAFNVSSSATSNLLETDFAKFGRPQLLLLALEAFEAARAGAPSLAQGSKQFAADVKSAAKRINDARPKEHVVKLDDTDTCKWPGEGDKCLTRVNSAIFDAIALNAGAVLSPMAALFGGIVGQEVVKAASAKFHPIHQWLLFESLESAPPRGLPSDHLPANPAEARYAHQISVIGRALHQHLTEQRVFMVGAGALGCEFLKNFAMMGVGTSGDKGGIVLTDDDTIERSNLSRQFLFRNSDVGKSKAAAAAKAAAVMNPHLRLYPMQDRVSPLTENVFNDEFWGKLSYVTNALDNVQARLYVDRRCVFFNKALFESGTLGTKCNTQVVIPHLTENYGASRDPQEKMVPDCTLHNFPHNISHCLSWARSEFIGQFSDRPRAAMQYAKCEPEPNTNDDGRAAFLAQLRQSGAAAGEIAQTVDGLKKCIGDRPLTFADCVAWARLLFEEYFVQKVLQLTHLYPHDAVNKSGIPFWSPPKRFPNAIVFDPHNELHLGFTIAAANLRAVTMGVTDDMKLRRNPDHIRELLAKVTVPAWSPKDNVKIKVDPNEDANANNANNADVDDNELKTSLASLPSPTKLRSVQFAPQEFEKDDSTNFHMDFIHTVANLRAFNYQVKQVDALQSKLIAGRIIPAIATTTAAATGLVCLEIYKYTLGAKLDAYRNSFLNLALPLFSLVEPMPPSKVVSRTDRRKPDPINHPEYIEEEEIEAYPNPHTVWDHYVVDVGDITIQEFIDYFKKKHGWTCNSIAVPVIVDKGETASMVYNSVGAAHKARLPQVFSSVYEKLTKQPLGDRKYFIPSCLFENDDGATIECPDIIFRFRK